MDNDLVSQRLQTMTHIDKNVRTFLLRDRQIFTSISQSCCLYSLPFKRIKYRLLPIYNTLAITLKSINLDLNLPPPKNKYFIIHSVAKIT